MSETMTRNKYGSDMEKPVKHKNMASGKEVLGHALGGVGQNTVYALWSGFITAFYTDVFGMNPAVMAGIFLFARIWDAVNDPMMGTMADRSNDGKYYLCGGYLHIDGNGFYQRGYSLLEPPCGHDE